MSDSAYGCVYFKSDKTISVIPKSRCILRDAFETLGEVEVKWRIQGKHQIFIGTILQVSSKQDKHLLERYTEDLHLYIRTCIKDNLEFSVDDLTRRWQLPHPGNVVENSSLVLVPTKPSGSQNPPPKKRRTEKANANPESSKQQESRTKSKGKNQKKSMESSSNLAAQEIIEITRFSNIFPPRQTNDKHFPSQQLQSAIPMTQIPQPRVKVQPAIQERLHPSPRSNQWHNHNLQQLTSPSSVSRASQPTSTNVLTSADVMGEMRGSGQTSVERLPLESTGKVYRTALSTLDEFSDDADSLICFDSTHDDSGIVGDYHDSTEETIRDDLREKIAKLESENAKLKRLLSTVPPPEVLEYFKRCIQHIDDSDTLIIDVDAVQTSPRDATTSYVVQANFKPAEGEVRLLKDHNVFVPGNKLRQIITEARLKGPLHLLQKLIPLIFTTEELANSCGQGLSQSTTKVDLTNKTPLDPIKTQVVKDYLLSFCVANGKECPVSKQVNETLTQQVSYARRKQKRNQANLQDK